MAVDEAGLADCPLAAPDRVGVIVGVGMGGIATLEEAFRTSSAQRLRRVSPFFIPRLIANMAPGQIAMRFGARGSNYATTSACASGAHAIGEAVRADPRRPSGRHASPAAPRRRSAARRRRLRRHARARRPRNDEPDAREPPVRPRPRRLRRSARAPASWCSRRSSTPRRAGRDIYAEVVGYGANCDAYHITQPAPEGEGAAECMRWRSTTPASSRSSVDYINAHGTATPYNDANETQAIKRVFGEHAARLAVSSTKSMTGHLLGAAGGVEAVYTALALRARRPAADDQLRGARSRVRPRLRAATRARERAIDVALSNSFGFGGTNACAGVSRAPGVTG